MQIKRSTITSLLAAIQGHSSGQRELNLELFKLCDKRKLKRVHLVRSHIEENLTPNDAEEAWSYVDEINRLAVEVWAAENLYTYSEDPKEEDRRLNGYVSAATGQFVPHPHYDEVPDYLSNADSALHFKRGWFGSDGLVMCIFESEGEWGSEYTVHLVEPDTGTEFAKHKGEIFATVMVTACLLALLNGWNHPLGWFEVVEE